MITPNQCRAARGLLGWTQQDLANKAGMSKTAINNFERGTSHIKTDSQKAIQNAFEQHQVQFQGDFGVNKLTDTVRILKGPDSLPELWNDIFSVMKDKGGEILISNVDESRSEAGNEEDLKNHLRRLADHGITERLLSCEGDTYFLQPVSFYRWLPKDVFLAGITCFIYENKVALQLWEDAMIVIINSQAAHEAEKKRFEYLWKNAVTPPAQN